MQGAVKGIGETDAGAAAGDILKRMLPRRFRLD